MLLTFLSLAITLFLIYIKQSVWFYLALFSFGFVSFSLAIDGNFYGWWDYMYVKGRVENTPLIIYFWMVYLAGFLTFVLLLKNKPIGINQRLLSPLREYKYQVRLRRFAYALFLLSTFAVVINLNRIGDLNILFSDPRAWEKLFGQYVLLNYMYFLHLPALVVLGVLTGKGYGKRLDWLIICILLSLTVFHGIKYTILHGFFFFLFALYLARNERLSKFFYFTSLVLFILMLSFFMFIRGGGVEGFRCGICYEYSVFNILTRKKLKLKEKPLIVMEGSFTTYQSNIQPEEMEEKIKLLIEQVKKYNGEFVFLWHNSSFNTPLWKKYQNIYGRILSK